MLKLMFALAGTAVCATAALALSGAVAVTAGGDPRVHRVAEKWLLAPGRAVADELIGKKARKQAVKTLEKAAEAAEEHAPAGLTEHGWNVAVWSACGFVLCLLMTLLFGVKTLSAALSLGLKAAFTLLLMQAAFVWAVAGGLG